MNLFKEMHIVYVQIKIGSNISAILLQNAKLLS